LGVPAASSIAQIELNAKAMGNLFCAPLISDQVAWRGNNIGLPPVGMILADNDLQTGSSDFRSDHLSEAFCGDAFLDHGEFPQGGSNRERSGQVSLKDPSKNMVYREVLIWPEMPVQAVDRSQ
jgi:hypothetical protein